MEAYQKELLPELRCDCRLVEGLLLGFIRDEVTKVGFRRVVLGLSGGLDSALCAFLGAGALGPGNVTAAIMPYRTSAPESVAHARSVVEALGIESVEVDITPMVDAFFLLFPDADNVRRGNKMARERMTILFDLSAAKRALVLGTSNKTELLLGYGTLFGDMASALNPIGDLYKSQVRQMARYMGVPAPILKKPPSADLWVGQTDEGELGFRYEEVDELLYFMIDKRYSREELLARGFPPAFVDGIHRLVQGSQYKRRLPLIAKVSTRTIDRDFRYARDWGR
ncbi:MAG: NAD+ synthase [Nitrospinota bacterium]